MRITRYFVQKLSRCIAGIAEIRLKVWRRTCLVSAHCFTLQTMCSNGWLITESFAWTLCRTVQTTGQSMRVSHEHFLHSSNHRPIGELGMNILLHGSNDWPMGESYGRTLCCIVQTTGPSMGTTDERLAAQSKHPAGQSVGVTEERFATQFKRLASRWDLRVNTLLHKCYPSMV